MHFIKVSAAPPTVEALLKSKICKKQPFPYGNEDNLTLYDPNCVKDMYICQDFCGKKCKKCYEKVSHSGECQRGILNEEFMFCPMRSDIVNDENLEFISYELVLDKTIKEGKKAYKKMECIRQDTSFGMFVTKFKKGFESYSKQKLEAWFLNTVKNIGSSNASQVPEVLFSVSDFAQNLKLSKKQETSEEYFHKTQITIFGTVSCLNVPSSENVYEQHSFSQITSSDVK